MDITRQGKKTVHPSQPVHRSISHFPQDDHSKRIQQNLPDELQGAAWIWSAEPAAGQQIRQFRRVIRSTEAVSSVMISVFAESRFQLWVNGQYISRGPAFHHPSRRPVEIHDLTPFWKPGNNVIAVMVQDPRLSLQTGTPTGRPGLIARISAVNAETGQITTWATDESWSVNDATGYVRDVPRRGWALGYIDVLDTSAAPVNWQSEAFDDSHWPPATVQPADSDIAHDWLIKPIPPLRVGWQSARSILSLHTVLSLPPIIRAEDDPFVFGEKLSSEPWLAPDGLILQSNLEQEIIRIDGLTRQRGAALVLDLGREYTGQVCFECTCPTAGTIDIGWSELMINGRPPVMRKKVSYADRLLATAGENRWEPLAFSAGRYVALVLRGFEGAVEFRKVGMRATEPDLSWQGAFESSDAVLNRVWELCSHSIRVGTQEGLMDCPTREQAPYLGDGNLIGRWLGMLTGDWRHWKYLVRESFVRQSPDGLLRDAVFSGQRRSILDYNLLAVIGARDYLAYSGDLQTIREILPACRNIFRWFDDRRNAQGLIDTTHHRMNSTGEWESVFDPKSDEDEWATILFIDHPGLGWHNVGEPEIDRRGINAAINAVYLIAREALRELETAVEGKSVAEHSADARMRKVLRSEMFDTHRKVFVDGVLNGSQLNQVSQQTNIWCLWAKLCEGAEETAILDRILDENHPNLARGGPYFFGYILPQMARLGRHREALELIRKLWRPMVDSDATTLWETFSGDHLDSRCHPWSAAPLEFLLCELLGLGELQFQSDKTTCKPRYDLLDRAQGTLMTLRGPVSIAWERNSSGTTHLSGSLPAGVVANLLSPAMKLISVIEGNWQVEVKP